MATSEAALKVDLPAKDPQKYLNVYNCFHVWFVWTVAHSTITGIDVLQI